MNLVIENSVDGPEIVFASSATGGEETTDESRPAEKTTDESRLAEKTTDGNQSAIPDVTTATFAEETIGLTDFDPVETEGEESGEGTAQAVPPVPAADGEIQMPVFLLFLLIAVICILGAVTIFLIVKLRKIDKNSAKEDGIKPAENPGGNSEIQSDPTENTEKETENTVPNPKVSVTVVPNNAHFGFSYEIGNVHNQGRREEQQDSFCVSDVSSKTDLQRKGLMAVVADGMGGLESGASVSQLVSNIFLNRYRGSIVSDCRSFLYEAVMESEREVEKYIEVNRVDGGSTLVAVMIKDGLLNFISVGDSFIFLIRAGKLIKLNTEHTYGNLLRERAARGEVDPEEAEINPKRASLTSYIGIGNLRLIDRSGTPIPVMDGDILFLCSDGVYNALGDDMLLSVITGGEFSEAAERVEQSVLMQNIPTQDNFTAVMIKITGGK